MSTRREYNPDHRTQRDITLCTSLHDKVHTGTIYYILVLRPEQRKKKDAF